MLRAEQTAKLILSTNENDDIKIKKDMRLLPDVAMAIHEHDTTGMAEPFTDISNRLKSVLIDIAHNKTLNENSNILIVTHAFAIKTLFYLFAPEKLCTMDKLKNATISKLLYDGKSFFFEKTDFE